ncbi:uncharacterized protein LOC133906507 [Phragmites australis]|uniref:uncharacterized protein LOC133906507 n=1 Tax=Phragmites australis TaxID=29695 RepID=UPI002D797C8F|nr:uncharacterized protein LOC133906507 [Phragmites australis]
MPTLIASTSSSPRCAHFACRRGTRTRRLPGPALADAHHGQGCGRPLGRAAGFVGGGIAAAFFASLERCSCVEVRTMEDDLLDDAEAEAATLMLGPAGGGGSKKSAPGGRRAAGKGKRAGFGCCENSASSVSV